MVKKVFLDDVRDPPDESWAVARSFNEFFSYIFTNGFPNVVSLDHDLGEDRSGFDVAKAMVELDMNRRIRMPDDFEFKVHSANGPGHDNIQFYLANYMKFKKSQQNG